MNQNHRIKFPNFISNTVRFRTKLYGTRMETGLGRD